MVYRSMPGANLESFGFSNRFLQVFVCAGDGLRQGLSPRKLSCYGRRKCAASAVGTAGSDTLGAQAQRCIAGN